jgi:hypothetical protein
MDVDALYSALNTIAQCSAALAALIGFLGLWRLDRLREERDRIWQIFRMVVGPEFTPQDRDDLRRYGEEYYVRKVRDIEVQEPPLARMRVRWEAIPSEQRQLMDVLQRFLRRTLVILALAISGLVVADALYSWVLTRWLTGLLIIVAAYRLWRDTAAVVHEAARSVRALAILALFLSLASPVWAGTPSRTCTTYEDQTLGRLQTLCDDGTRGISTYNKTLERWDTTIIASPRQSCTGQLNPTTSRWEGRCR